MDQAGYAKRLLGQTSENERIVCVSPRGVNIFRGGALDRHLQRHRLRAVMPSCLLDLGRNYQRRQLRRKHIANICRWFGF